MSIVWRTFFYAEGETWHVVLHCLLFSASPIVPEMLFSADWNLQALEQKAGTPREVPGHWLKIPRREDLLTYFYLFSPLSRVPSLSETTDWFHGRQLFHGSGLEGEQFRDDSSTLHLLCTLFLLILYQLYWDYQALDPGGWRSLL